MGIYNEVYVLCMCILCVYYVYYVIKQSNKYASLHLYLRTLIANHSLNIKFI